MKHRIPTLLLISCLALLCAPSVNAQDHNTVDFPDGDLTSHDWRTRVEKARRQSQDFISGARSKTFDDFDAAKERARIADERAMNDDSLREGDVISTSKGLLLFKGALDRERHFSDFVPIESSRE